MYQSELEFVVSKCSELVLCTFLHQQACLECYVDYRVKILFSKPKYHFVQISPTVAQMITSIGKKKKSMKQLNQ